MTDAHPNVDGDGDGDGDAAAIPAEEERLLARALASLAARAAAMRAAGAAGAAPAGRRAYVDELVALRDEIGEARLEDVPQLIAQMERLQEVSLTAAEAQTVLVDPASPYFGHLRLRERVAGRGDGRARRADRAGHLRRRRPRASASSTGGTRRSASSSTATPRAATTRSASASARSRGRSWPAAR